MGKRGRAKIVEKPPLSRPLKRLKPASQHGLGSDGPVKHTLLAQYYSSVQTLREYLLAKLPASSRIRRKKIASVGLVSSSAGTTCTDAEVALGHILDTTLVGCRANDEPASDISPALRWEQWIGFSQRGDESYVTLSDGPRGSIYSQSEVSSVRDQESLEGGSQSAYIGLCAIQIRRLSTLSFGSCFLEKKGQPGPSICCAMASGSMLVQMPKPLPS